MVPLKERKKDHGRDTRSFTNASAARIKPYIKCSLFFSTRMKALNFRLAKKKPRTCETKGKSEIANLKQKKKSQLLVLRKRGLYGKSKFIF